jgi:isocitrate/isopropylmalate dehydrogenase
MMLQHIGEAAAADRIYAALIKVFTERKIFTFDLGGAAATTEFAKAILEEVGAQ